VISDADRSSIGSILETIEGARRIREGLAMGVPKRQMPAYGT
jgi:hypothetical protein